MGEGAEQGEGHLEKKWRRDWQAWQQTASRGIVDGERDDKGQE